MEKLGMRRKGVILLAGPTFTPLRHSDSCRISRIGGLDP